MLFEFITFLGCRFRGWLVLDLFPAHYLVTWLVVVVDVLKHDVHVAVLAADPGTVSSSRTVHRLFANHAVVRAMSLVGAVIATQVVVTTLA